MNKEQVKFEYARAVLSLGLPSEQVVLGAGGACVMFGTREMTNDLDLDIPEKDFNHLANSYSVGHYKDTRNGVTFFISLNEVSDLHVTETPSAVCIEGVWCWTPEYTLQFKERLNRPKDQEDISRLKLMVQSN